MTLSRRHFGALAAGSAGALLAGGPAALAKVAAKRAKPNSVVNGVRLGLQPFSYHDLIQNDMNRPYLIQGAVEDNMSIIELHAGWVQPFHKLYGQPDEVVWKWILDTPLSFYEPIRKEFDDAGIEIYQYNMGGTRMRKGIPFEVVDKIFQVAKVLGAKGLTDSSATLSRAEYLAPVVSRQKGMFYALHGHDNTSDPDAMSSEETFIKGLAMSPNFTATLDLRHFTAANGDAIGFLQRHHARVTSIHLGDRRRDNGQSEQFGRGDSPIVEVLRQVRDNKWPITILLEFEHGTLRSGIEEVRAEFEYCKQALA